MLDSSPGYPVATYSESGGQLTVIAELVGYFGTGSFIQSAERTTSPVVSWSAD